MLEIIGPARPEFISSSKQKKTLVLKDSDTPLITEIYFRIINTKQFD
jgi:hypothetical protein